MIHNTVSTISCHDSSWPVAAASQLSCLLPTATCPEEATVALSALAIATAVIEDKNVVSGHLDTILNKLKGYNLDSKVSIYFSLKIILIYKKRRKIWALKDQIGLCKHVDCKFNKKCV